MASFYLLFVLDVRRILFENSEIYPIFVYLRLPRGPEGASHQWFKTQPHHLSMFGENLKVLASG